MYYWTSIRKNRARYGACRGIGDETVPKVLQRDLIINEAPLKTLEQLLDLPPVRRYYREKLKTDLEREHFQQHLARYMYMYSPDAPFEVSTTNRYLVDTHEAAVTARADITRGEVIRHLTGVQVPLTKDEEKTLDLTRRDFSVVVSARKRTVSLFLGPARFANHDCDANARLRTCGNRGMEVIAVKDIKTGEEITVTYSEDYFGVDNKECLCATCEQYERNGWADDGSPVPEDVPLTTDHRSSSRTRSETETGSNSRASSKARQESKTPTRKRKSDVASLDSSDRSPKRLDPARSFDVNARRNLSSLSNEVRPQDIPDPVPVAPNEHVSSPLEFSTSTSSKSSHADGVSLSTAPTSLSEQDQTHTQKKWRVERVKPCDEDKDPVSQAQFRNSKQNTPNEADPNGKLISQLESASNAIGMPVIAEPSEEVAEFTESASKSRRLPDTKGRRPGDYTLTVRLLCTPYSRWVQCKVCESDFVQTDAYQTRFACPRCERHSKLYGYMWPKTEKEGKFDDEERILDHREVNRFVGPQQEKEIKKGKEKALKNLLKEREERVSSSGQDDDEWEDVTPVRGRVFRKSLGKRTFYGRGPEVEEIFSQKRPEYPLDLLSLQEAQAKQRKHQPGASSRHKKVRAQIQPSTDKRKYVRSGHYTREAMAQRAAAREAMRQQIKREKQQRRRQLKQMKQASTSKVKVELKAAKISGPKSNLAEVKPKDPLPPGMKKSKWKGWVLVPAADDVEDVRKTYDASGKRISEKEGSETPSEPEWRASSSRTATWGNLKSRNARPAIRAAASSAIQPRQKRKYVRSGKYIGVAEARRRKKPLPPPIPRPKAAKSRIVKLKTRPLPKHSDQILYEPKKKHKSSPEALKPIKEEDKDDEDLAELVNSSLYETTSESDVQSEGASGMSATFSASDFESAEEESESELEGPSKDRFSRRKSMPTRHSARQKSTSPVIVTETRRAHRFSKPARDTPPAERQQPVSAGKLKRVSPGKRPPLPRGWEYEFPDEEDMRRESSEREMDMDWEAEASTVARARANSSVRRSRKTI